MANDDSRRETGGLYPGGAHQLLPEHFGEKLWLQVGVVA